MNITASEMRERDYYGHLHYYYVFDMDLNGNDMRFLMLIQQMQSNPDPKVKPFFSYAWVANLLGIKRRQAIYIAKKLKEKGYIVHKETEDGKWLWKLPTKTILGDNPSPDDQCTDETLVHSECTPLVQPQCTPLVQPDCTHKYNNLKANKLNTASCFAAEKEPAVAVEQEASKPAFVIGEELDRELLRLNQSQEMYAKDNREFLLWCKYNLDVKITADTPEGKVKVLKSWIRNGGLKKPSGFDSPRKAESFCANPEKPSNLGYGYTTPKPVEEVDKQIEEFAWKRVERQNAPKEVLKAIANDAANLAKSHLKPMEDHGGGAIAKQERDDVTALTVAYAALKHGQVKNIDHFKEKIKYDPIYNSARHGKIADLINKQLEGAV